MLPTLEILGVYALLGFGVFAVARAVERTPPLWVMFTAWLLPIFLFWPCVFSGLTPLPVDLALTLPPWSHVTHVEPYNGNLNDAATQMAPWQKAVREAWREGSLPFWNRWNGCGMPLAATGLTEAFSPLTFLTFPLSIALGFTVLVLAKLLLAFCGMWLWLAEMRVSKMASVVGGILFGFSLSMTGWALLPPASVLCLWPWGLFGFEVVRDPRRRSRGLVLLGAVLVCWGLSHPEMAALGALLLVLWAVARESRDIPTERRRVLISTAACAVSAVGLTAFLLVPEAFVIEASNRARSAVALWRNLPFSAAPHGPVWKGYLTLLFPTSLGDDISTRALSQLSPASFLETGLGYFGLVGWAAALCFLRPGGARRSPEWILFGLVVSGGSIALGCWPLFEAFLHLPIIRLTPPLRYFSWVSVAGAALAAFELDRLTEDLDRDRRHIISLTLILIMLGVAATLAYRNLAPLYRVVGDLEAHRRNLLWAEATLSAALLCCLGVALVRRARLLVPLLGVVGCFELACLGRHLYRFGSPADLFPPTPLLRFLARQAPPFRVLGEGLYIFPNSNVFPALQEIRTHDSVERRDYVDYLDRIAGYDTRAYFRTVRNVDAPELDRLNVKYLVSSPDRKAPSAKWRLIYSGFDGRVFENTHAWPRVFTLDPETGGLGGGLTVTDYRESTNSITFKADVHGRESALAQTSIVSDGGWHAYSDTGAVLSVVKAGGLFVSLVIPAGTHRVHLYYRPPGFVTGATLSVTTAFVLAAAVYFQQRKRKTNGVT